MKKKLIFFVLMQFLRPDGLEKGKLRWGFSRQRTLAVSSPSRKLTEEKREMDGRTATERTELDRQEAECNTGSLLRGAGTKRDTKQTQAQ